MPTPQRGEQQAANERVRPVYWLGRDDLVGRREGDQDEQCQWEPGDPALQGQVGGD